MSKMWQKCGIALVVVLVLLECVLAEDKTDVKSRSKRSYRKKGGRVAYRVLDEHNDHGHDDYAEHNFFGNDYEDGGGYGGGHSDYQYGHGDYHGGDEYGDDHYDDHYGGHDDYEGYGHSASDYHDGGGDFHNYGDDYHDYGNDYGHYGGGGGGGGGGYGKSSRQKYKPVKSKRYKPVYKPRVVVIKKIVPLSTTTMP